MPFKYNPITNKLDLVQEEVVPPPGGTDSLAGNTGLATESGGVINVPGDNTQGIDTTGAGDTLTITAFNATTTQIGVSELASDAEAIAGSVTTNIVINPSSLKAKLGDQTSNAVAFGAGDSSALSWTAALEDGQLVIGSTAGNPAAANITSTGATVEITNGANTINLETGATVASSYTTDSGTAVPALGVLQVLGGTGISTAGATNVVTINLDTPVTVANGGTGASTLTGVLTGNGTSAISANTVTQHAVLLGGTSNAVSNVASLGSSGDILTSNGAGSNPTFETPDFVTGPASSTNQNIARWDGTSGDALLNSLVSIDFNGNLTVSNSTGAVVGVNVSNLGGPARARLQSLTSSSGDPYMEANLVAGNGYAYGIDNSVTGEPLSFTFPGAAPSFGTVYWLMTASGERTIPLQPAFQAYMDTTVTNVTGDGTAYTVIFDTEVFDQNADFNLGTSVFTAPVTGQYRFSYSILVVGGTTITAAVSSLFTSNRQYDQYESVAIAGTDEVLCQFSMLVDMDAADTAHVIVTTTDSGGKIDDISGLITNVVSCFSGQLEL